MLSNDIIRDVLICIDKNCEGYTDDSGRFVAKAKLNWKKVYEDELLCEKYDIDDIKYCLLKCKEADIIDATIAGRSDRISSLYINGLSWKGHEFLKNIVDDNIWNKVKRDAGHLSRLSFDVIMKVASDLALATIKTKLGLV